VTRTRLFFCLLIALALGDFAFRAVIPAYEPERNDFPDPYCASRIWLEGQNPYDVAFATEESVKIVHSPMSLVPVYPPTAYVLVAPLSALPWKLANLLWVLLGVGAVGVMAYVLPGIAGLSFGEDRT
jgi:hypothetical protein